MNILKVIRFGRTAQNPSDGLRGRCSAKRWLVFCETQTPTQLACEHGRLFPPSGTSRPTPLGKRFDKNRHAFAEQRQDRDMKTPNGKYSVDGTGHRVGLGFYVSSMADIKGWNIRR